jgi:hypothetical protein
VCRNIGPGLEYVVSFAAEPSLYVIKRQYRTSPESATQQAFYYVLYGSIYQAPSLLSCLQMRADRCRYHVQKAFDRLKADLEPLGWRERQREQKVKRACRQRDSSGRKHQSAMEADPADASEHGGVCDGEDNATKENATEKLEYDMECEGALWMAQPPPAPPALSQWILHTDNIIMNVLSRCVALLFTIA